VVQHSIIVDKVVEVQGIAKGKQNKHKGIPRNDENMIEELKGVTTKQRGAYSHLSTKYHE
jgi:hypothetical protein